MSRNRVRSFVLSRTVICFGRDRDFSRSSGSTRGLVYSQTIFLNRCLLPQTHTLRAEPPQPLPFRNVLCFHRHGLGGKRRVRFSRLRRQESTPGPLLQRRLRDHFYQGVSPLSNGSSHLKEPLARVGDGSRDKREGERERQRER